MAATNIDLLAYSDALLVLGTAGVIVPAVHRWRVNPVLTFLVAGAVLGPLGIGSFKDVWPSLQWVTITDAKNVAAIAELGVVFLLFLIGLELSYERLLTMRRLVFGLGSLQVVISSVAISIDRGAARQHGSGRRHHRPVPGAVLDRDRHRAAVRAAPPDELDGPRQLRRAAAAGPGRRADAAAGQHPGRRQRTLDRHRRHDRAGAGRARRRPDRA